MFRSVDSSRHFLNRY